MQQNMHALDHVQLEPPLYFIQTYRMYLIGGMLQNNKMSMLLTQLRLLLSDGTTACMGTLAWNL